MVLKLTYRERNGEDKVIEAVISPDNSKVYIPPDWQGFSLYELLTDKRKGEFVRLETLGL